MSVATWSSDTFLQQAREWVGERCAALAITLSGEWDQPHVRPWSSAIRFESDAGPLWFKVNGVGTAFEAGLTGLLAGLLPDLVAEVLAVDEARAWSLTRDGGPVLRSVLDVEDLWDVWPDILQRHAAAQLALGGHEDELLATGIDVRTPVALPLRVRVLLKELADTPVERGGLTTPEAHRLEGRLGEYDEWCAELSGSGIPDSVQHDDLHSSNVCWDATAAQARIIDWGDASWGHPLATMLCTLNSIAYHAGVEVEDASVRRVRDAYLEPFTGLADRRALVRYVELARRTGCVTRALSYRAALRESPLSVHEEYEFPVRGWLLELLEDWTRD